MSIILAGLTMAGFFITLEKIGVYHWFYDWYIPRRPLSWLPGQICEHCLTFWASFLFHYQDLTVAGVVYAFIAGLASSAVNYLVRK